MTMLAAVRRSGSIAYVIARAALAVLAVALIVPAGAAAAQPVDLAAPYEYLGWGSPPPPTEVMSATGVHDLTLAFMLSKGSCDPEWDGQRPLIGGPDQSAIDAIRAAGGDVVVSFGGWSGKKLGSSCHTTAALAAAYQKVIGAYSLKAIDVDIEHGEIANKKTRKRVVEALAIVQREDPAIEISITLGTAESGPEAQGLSLIDDAAAIGFQPTAWTIMPFDFGPAQSDMGHASIRAVEGLAGDLAAAYAINSEQAYAHAGISSMNGRTDESSETVTPGDFETILAFAQAHHLARLTFWSVNRDRECPGSVTVSDECSGISQAPWAFTKLIAQYHG